MRHTCKAAFIADLIYVFFTGIEEVFCIVESFLRKPLAWSSLINFIKFPFKGRKTSLSNSCELCQR